MEKIKETALKFVYEDNESPYDILLKKGNHDMFFIVRLRNMATEIFKALHGSKCNTVTYCLNSFQYKGAKISNDLPKEIKNSITLVEFKKKKNSKDQSVFAICVQYCYRMQLIFK